MNVTVLSGGPSDEREVSLLSGQSVANALDRSGHAVALEDIGPGNLTALDRKADVVFPCLHGWFGESGELQEELESRQMAFVGSGSAASRLGIDKIKTKSLWEQTGLPTPRWQAVGPANDSFPFEAFLPGIVKAPASGSSIDVFLCRSKLQMEGAIAAVLEKHGLALVEQFIEGIELTIGFLDEKPLPAIQVITKHDFFDFSAKYADDHTEHRFEIDLPRDVLADCQNVALKAYKTIGCRDLGRIDIMVDRDHQPYLLEINTMPGFTPRSLLPDAAAHAGMNFEAVVNGLVKRASARQTTVIPRALRQSA